MSRQTGTSFADINAIKADFKDIYRRTDPRSYYTVLGGLDYVIPEVAKPVFLQLADRCIAERGRPITILDIGCSYGVNAALLRHDVALRQLRERYLSPSIQALSPEAVMQHDAQYFAGWPGRADISIIGVDASPEAVRYACGAGLLADGVAADLETHGPSQRARGLISQADLIISTGCVGYITHKTFERILSTIDGPSRPWIASFVLRMFDYSRIAEMVERNDLLTEKWEGATFVQRRFRDKAELAETIAALEALGIDPTGKEADGLLHAELFVSRPGSSIKEKRLTDIVSLTSGAARPFGDRHRLPALIQGELAA